MSTKDTLFSIKQTINCHGRLIDFSTPRVMGILNVTPDSFYDGGFYGNEKVIVNRVSEMLSEGADIIDIGAYSSRPGAAPVPSDAEMERLRMALHAIRSVFSGVILSVDTFRSEIASLVVREFGVSIINDISAGLLDDKMIPTVGELQVPYIMMHMQGTPQSMQKNPEYQDVTKEILAFFAKRISLAQNAGIQDIVLDPGFGFGKTMEHNYTLLRELNLFNMLGWPVMVGISRKSMIYKSLNTTPANALNGTTVLNTLALHNGAKLLRVHDVREAVETVQLYTLYLKASTLSDKI